MVSRIEAITRLRVLDNRVMRKIFVPERDEATGESRNYVMRSFMLCSAHTILLGYQTKKEETGGAFFIRGGGKGFQVADGRITLKWIVGSRMG